MEYLGILPTTSRQLRKARLSRVDWKEIFSEKDKVEYNSHVQVATRRIPNVQKHTNEVKPNLYRFEPRHNLEYTARTVTNQDMDTFSEVSSVSTQQRTPRRRPLQVVGKTGLKTQRRMSTASMSTVSRKNEVHKHDEIELSNHKEEQEETRSCDDAGELEQKEDTDYTNSRMLEKLRESLYELKVVLESIWDVSGIVHPEKWFHHEVYHRSSHRNKVATRIPQVNYLSEHRLVPVASELKHLTSSLIRRHLENIHMYSKVREHDEELLEMCSLDQMCKHLSDQGKSIMSDLIFIGGQIGHVLQHSPKLAAVLLRQLHQSNIHMSKGFAKLLTDGLFHPLVASEHLVLRFILVLLQQSEARQKLRSPSLEPLWAGQDYREDGGISPQPTSSTPLWTVLENIASWEQHLNFLRQFWLEPLEHPPKDPLELLFNLLHPLFSQDPRLLPPLILAVARMLRDSQGRCGVHLVSFLFEGWLGRGLAAIGQEVHGTGTEGAVRVEFLTRVCSAQRALQELSDSLAACAARGVRYQELDRRRGYLSLVEGALAWVDRLDAGQRPLLPARLPAMSTLAAVSRCEVACLLRCAQCLEGALGTVAPSCYEVAGFRKLVALGKRAGQLLDATGRGGGGRPHGHLPHRVNAPSERSRMLVVTVQDPARDPALDSSNDSVYWATHDASRLQFLVQQSQEAMAREGLLGDCEAGLETRLLEVQELGRELGECRGLGALLCAYQEEAEHGLLRSELYRQLMEITLRRSSTKMRASLNPPDERQLPEVDADDDSEFFDIFE